MPDPVETLELPGGVRTTATPEEAERRKAAGATGVSVGQVAAEQGAERQKSALTSWGEKLTTFGEGIADALSFGYAHERGTQADLRRDLNSGSALAGELTGTAIGLAIPGSPERALAGFGERLGAGAAKAFGAGKLTTAMAKEAGVGAALSGAAAFGHQAFDSLIEDKPFAAEAVAKEAGFGALLGAGAGLFGGAMGRFAQGDVAAQGGLSAAGTPEAVDLAAHAQSVTDALDRAVDEHATRYGAIRAIEDDGHIPLASDFMPPRKAALAEAQATLKKLRSFDPAKSIDRLDPEYFKTLDDAQEALADLDKAMAMRETERLVPQELGRPTPAETPVLTSNGPVPPFGVFEKERAGVTPAGKDSEVLDAQMRNPENAARYRELMGRDFEPVLSPGELMDRYVPASPEEAPEPVPEVARGPEEGRATPVESTRAGKVRPKAEAPENTLYEGLRAREMRPEDLDAVLSGARVITPSERALAADNALHGEFTDRPLIMTRDGRFMPPATIEANRAYFQAKYPEVVEPVAPPIPQAENAADFARFLDKVETTRNQAGLPPSSPAQGRAPGTLDDLGDLLGVNAQKSKPEAIRAYLDDWYNSSRRVGPERMGPVRVSPFERAAADIHVATEKVYEATGGRADAAAAMELGPKFGLPEPRTSFTSELQAAALLKKAAEDVRAVAAGAGNPRSATASWLKRRFFGKAGAMVAGSLIGGHLGGPLGYMVGASLAGKYAGTAGRAASAAGRMARRVAGAAESLTAGHRGTVALAIGVGRPYAYSDEGPVKDPVDRILELKRAAANQVTLRASVRAQLGDLVAVHPPFAKALEDAEVNRVTALSIRAPAIYFDNLGVPRRPGDQAMRSWLEYEGAAHNPDRVVDAIGSGAATRNQIDALRETAPATYAKLVGEVLARHETFPTLDRGALRYLETVTGATLTRTATPGMVARNQMATVAPPQDTGGRGETGPGNGKPQAFKLNQNPMATQAQGAPSGRAPGN